MTNEPHFWLHSVSVVVTAQFHNPSILNPDFLESREIVPEGWEVEETVTTPPMSVVKYTNGVQWAVEQGKLTVAEKCEGEPFKGGHRVHGLANAYLRKLPHVPYRELRLN